MLKLFKRKTYKEERIANQFVEQFFHSIDQGFPEVAALINESPEFINCPNIDSEDSDKFLLIILAANIKAVHRFFPSHTDQTLTRKILEQVSEQGGVGYSALTSSVVKYQQFISKVNHPSKNLVYGMSKALFFKYELSQFQEEYFKHLNSPNPILLKRLDEAVVNFLWDWEGFSD